MAKYPWEEENFTPKKTTYPWDDPNYVPPKTSYPWDNDSTPPKEPAPAPVVPRPIPKAAPAPKINTMGSLPAAPTNAQMTQSITNAREVAAQKNNEGLTPQQIIQKYQQIVDNKNLTPAERNSLLKPGIEELNKIARQGTAFAPKMAGKVTYDDIKQAMELRDRAQRQTSGTAAAMGLFNSAGFGLAKNANDQQRQVFQETQAAQPGAYTTGSMAGEALKYGATANLLSTVPGFNSLQQSEKVVNRLLAGRVADIIPDTVTAVQESSSPQEALKNLGANFVTGLAFDAGLEGIGALAKAAKNNAKIPDAPQPIPKAPEPIQPQPIPRAPQPTQPQPIPVFGKNTVGSAESPFPAQQKVSRVRSNTIENSPMFTDAERSLLDPSDFKYDVVSEKKSMREAADRLSADFDGEVKDLFNKQVFDGVDLDTSMGVLERFKNEARGLPVDSPEQQKVIQWVKQIQEKGTEAGQRIQALAKYSRTPEGAAVKAQTIIADKIKQLDKSDPNLFKAIDDLADQLGKVANEYRTELPVDPQAAFEKMRSAVDSLLNKNKRINYGEEFKASILKAMEDSRAGKDVYKDVINQFSQIPTLTGTDIINIMDIMSEAEKFPLYSRQRMEIENAAYKIVADKFNSSAMEKLTAWRYMGMLTNPTTHIRNVTGNTVFGGVTRIKNDVGALIEESINNSRISKGLQPFDRTKALLSSSDQPLLDAAKADYEDFYQLVAGSGKYNPARRIDDQRTIFKTQSDSKLVQKSMDVLEGIRKGNSNILEWEDNIALKNRYAENLSRYLKANGLNETALKSQLTGLEKTLDQARLYAAEQAQKATFRDQNNWVQAIVNFSNINKVTHILTEGILPFKKTPINIVKRGIEYSPIGLVKGMADLFTAVKKGSIPASQAIDEIASGLTGSGVLALGAFLSYQGLVVGAPSDDKKERGFGALQGQQNYALKLGNKYYTLDWLSPAAMPLFVGVQLMESQKSKNPNNTDAATEILDAMTKIGEPVLEMTLLQGVNDAIKSASYNQTSALAGILGTAASNYANQMVPTIGGKLARSIDPIQRSTYTEPGTDPLTIGRTAQRAQQKIPFASENLQPRIDQWGREVENVGGSFAGRLAYNMLSPGYYSEDKSTPVDKEIDRLYRETGDNAVLPGYAPKQFTTKGRKYTLTANEYTQYAKIRGQEAFDALSRIIENPMYKSLSEKGKTQIVARIYDNANEKAKKEILKNK